MPKRSRKEVIDLVNPIFDPKPRIEAEERFFSVEDIVNPGFKIECVEVIGTKILVTWVRE